jgi:hypothetical protein
MPGLLHALDEMGTLETLHFLLCNQNEVEQKEISELNSIDVPEEVLQVHGYAPTTKAEGTARLIYKNVNGFCNWLTGNEKVERAQELHDELEMDIAAYCEHRLNMHHKKNCNGFNTLFKGGEATFQSIFCSQCS